MCALLQDDDDRIIRRLLNATDYAKHSTYHLCCLVTLQAAGCLSLTPRVVLCVLVAPPGWDTSTCTCGVAKHAGTSDPHTLWHAVRSEWHRTCGTRSAPILAYTHTRTYTRQLARSDSLVERPFGGPTMRRPAVEGWGGTTRSLARPPHHSSAAAAVQHREKSQARATRGHCKQARRVGHHASGACPIGRAGT
jgi:hypothetical protein